MSTPNASSASASPNARAGQFGGNRRSRSAGNNQRGKRRRDLPHTSRHNNSTDGVRESKAHRLCIRLANNDRAAQQREHRHKRQRVPRRELDLPRERTPPLAERGARERDPGAKHSTRESDRHHTRSARVARATTEAADNINDEHMRGAA